MHQQHPPWPLERRHGMEPPKQGFFSRLVHRAKQAIEEVIEAVDTIDRQEQFSTDRLHGLYDVLLGYPQEGIPKSRCIEAIRSIAEALIWGDQNRADNAVFEFFVQNNVMRVFHRFLYQHYGNRSGQIAIQVLQVIQTRPMGSSL
jgi:hypothetical protein